MPIQDQYSFPALLCLLVKVLHNRLHSTRSNPESANTLDSNITLARILVGDNRTSGCLDNDSWQRLLTCALDNVRPVESLPYIMEVLATVLNNERVLEIVLDTTEYDKAFLIHKDFAKSIAKDNTISHHLSPDLWSQLLEAAFQPFNETTAEASGRFPDDPSYQSMPGRGFEEVFLILDIGFKETIEYDKALELLPVARHCGLMEAVEKFSQVLMQGITLSNCIQIFHFAGQEELEELWTKAYEFVLENFELLTSDDGAFCSLSLTELCTILLSDDLVTSDEERVFEVGLRWIEKDLSDRIACLPTLVNCLRLPCCEMAFLKRLRDHGLLTYLDTLRTSIQVMLSTDPEHREELAQQQRRCGRGEVLFVIGGYDTSSVEVFDEHKKRWLKIQNVSDPPNGFTWCVSIGQYILVIEQQGQKVRVWNPTTGEWKDRAPLPSRRSYFSVATLNGHVYVLGGRENNASTTARCDVFNPDTNKWTQIPSLNTARRVSAAISLHGKLYCAGGTDKESTILTNVEVFHRELNIWTESVPMINARRNFSLVTCGQYVWAFGGYDGKNILKEVEKLDPLSRIWTKMPDMPTPRYSLAVALLNGRFYAVGGNSGVSTHTQVSEIYDPNLGSWTKSANTNIPRFNHGVFVLKVSKHILLENQ